jgi:hypothetical protein
MTRGLSIFLLILALTAGTLALKPMELRVACLLGLGVLWFATPSWNSTAATRSHWLDRERRQR